MSAADPAGGSAIAWEDVPRFTAAAVERVLAAAREADTAPLVALDIDGTLLGHDGSLAPEVIDGVARLREAGVHVVLATGRSVPALLPVAHWLGLDSGYAVCSNGAVTITLRRDGGYDLVSEVTFDAGPAVRAMLAEDPEVIVAVEDLGQGFKATRHFPAGELSAPTQLVDLEELLAEPVSRVVLRAPTRTSDHFSEMVARAGLHGVTYAVGWTAWLDLTPPGVSKASALDVVRETYGVPAGATLAAGDGQNDREMLQWAALGVAMGSADAGTIAVADVVTGHVDENGVVPVLRAALP